MQRTTTMVVAVLVVAMLALVYLGYLEAAFADGIVVAGLLSLWLNRQAASRRSAYPSLYAAVVVWLALWLAVAFVRHPAPSRAHSWIALAAVLWASLMLADSCRALAATWTPSGRHAVATVAAPLAAALAGLVFALWSARGH